MKIIEAGVLLTQKYNQQARCLLYKTIKIIPHLYNAKDLDI